MKSKIYIIAFTFISILFFYSFSFIKKSALEKVTEHYILRNTNFKNAITQFNQKVKELQELFKTESLDKLKEINLTDNYGQEITTGIELAGQGNEEGSEGSGDTEDEDD
mgnify:CR=1 FL=1